MHFRLSDDIRVIVVLVRVVLRLGMCERRGVVDGGGDAGGIRILVVILLRWIDRIIRGGVMRFLTLTLRHFTSLFLIGVDGVGHTQGGVLRRHLLVSPFRVFLL